MNYKYISCAETKGTEGCKGAEKGSFRADLWHEYLEERRCHLLRRLTFKEEPLGERNVEDQEAGFKHVMFEICK